MSAIWSDEARFARWLEVELAALDGWAEIGVVPRAAVDAIRAGATVPTPERVAELEALTQHDVAAFVDAVAEQLGDEGRWFHYGLTSSDVLDTALSLQLREAGALILDGLERALVAVTARAEEHRRTIAIGRTHGVHAEPTTFGLKLAGLGVRARAGPRPRRARARGDAGREAVRRGRHLLRRGSRGRASRLRAPRPRAGAELDADPPARSPRRACVNALALAAASLERFALEIRHLARTEVREVEEPFGSGQKGSSAMPHKRNPIVSERICGLARVVRGAAVTGLENVALWHERDISHSSAERIVLPDAFLAVDYMLDRFAWLVEGLVVRAERMRENLDSSHRLYFSQRLLLALVEANLSRDDAYRLVQRHAMRAWDEGLDFPELVRADAELAGRVDLDAVFDLDAYTQHVDVVFERLRALREEHAHA